jgi:hypothetical protein
LADKYERWNKWAPRYIADLMKDFGLTDFQAAAFPGNFAAESGYFNELQEKDPLVSGSKGGRGHAQWTGPRRKTFEAWLKRSGHDVDSYEGNYSMVFRELKSAYYDRVVLEPLKKAKNLEEAVKIVGKYYEAPEVLNMKPRLKGAQEALDLYHKLPPVAPADDHDVVVTALDQISHDLQEIAQKVTTLAATLKGSAPTS